MAALENVNVVISSITVDGISYVESDLAAVVDDIIRFDEDDITDMTQGGYYVVTHVDSSDDPHVVDDDDDDHDLCSDEYTVFKRQTTAATSSEQFVHAGITYSKVKRHAVVGERVLIVDKWEGDDRYKDGDVLTVDRIDRFDGMVYVTSIGQRGIAAIEYVVLEPVLTANETVVHDGITYNAVKRNVRPGDKLIVCTTSRYGFFTVGKVYEISRIDGDGDPRTTDNDGDDGCLTNGNYSVLEPVQTPTPTSADIIVHNGQQYHKVTRPANVGEIVLVVESFCYGKTGDIATVTSVNRIGGDIITDKHELMNDTRYVVLEPVVATVGDNIRITRFQSGAPVGTVVTVTHSGGYGVGYSYNGSNLGASHDAYEIVVKQGDKTETSSETTTINGVTYLKETRKPKIGETVLIVNAVMCGDKYKTGDVIVVTTVDSYGDPRINGCATFAHEYVVLTPKTSPARLKAGEYAKVVADKCGHDVAIGTIVKVLADDRTEWPFNAVPIGADPDDDKWFTIDDLERVTVSAGELTAAKKLAVWTSIGRTVDQYKNGDIVRVTEFTGNVPIGSIGSLYEVSGNSFRVSVLGITTGNWHNPSAVELIVPVESRKDLTALAVTA